MGEGETLFGGALDCAPGRAPHPQLALTLPSHLKEPDLRLSYEAHQSPAFQGSPQAHLPSPKPGLRRRPGSEPAAPPPRSPRPAPQLGLRGRRPRPPAGSIVYHPQQKRPKRLGAGGRRGEWAHPSGPGGPADAELRPPPSPSRVPPLAPPSGLGVRVPATLPSAPAPTHHWPAPAPRAARVPQAPSPHQPSGKLSNSRWSPQLESPESRRARGARAGPGRTPTGCLAGSGPETLGWAAASQRSTEEKQVELHDWGGAGGCPRGQTREPRGRRLRAQSSAGADCAATPRQVSPPEQ
ncbi:basic proline-rich protein-like [Panthera pardus]|uniref:Basic proline-rich protein-like n=1 Tax=Panthera pardus TaxID=9691 RepID=A0A9V1FC71_PANPR|nr:basic proline-rich protein-like [Panthera pardus]XP_042763723.1 basic proline-rich protein-like [Panthera leo]